MDTIVTLNLAGYALAIAGGIVLGMMFGRKVLNDLASIAHAFEARLSSLESKLIHHGATAIDSASHRAANANQAAAPVKAVEEKQSRAASSDSPHPAAH